MTQYTFDKNTFDVFLLSLSLCRALHNIWNLKASFRKIVFDLSWFIPISHFLWDISVNTKLLWKTKRDKVIFKTPENLIKYILNFVSFQIFVFKLILRCKDKQFNFFYKRFSFLHDILTVLKFNYSLKQGNNVIIILANYQTIIPLSYPRKKLFWRNNFLWSIIHY